MVRILVGDLRYSHTNIRLVKNGMLRNSSYRERIEMWRMFEGRSLSMFKYKYFVLYISGML